MISGTVQQFRNENGRTNLQYRSSALHSRRDPRREAERQAAALKDRLADLEPKVLTLVVGLGWGYLLEALAPIPPGLFFFEPLDEAAARWRETGREAELAALCPDRLIATADALSTALASGGAAGEFDRIRIEITPAYRRLFPNLSAELAELVRMALPGSQADDATAGPGSAAVDRKTAGHFFLRWGRNFARRLAAAETLEFIEGSGDGTPLYCGAGPGLIEDLAALIEEREGPARSNRRPGELRSKLYMIAADTALAPLLARGLRPDLVLSVDSGPGTEYHFRAVESWLGTRGRQRELPLDIPVLTWNAGPTCLPLFFRRIYTYRSTLPFDQLLGAGPLEAIPEWRNLARNTMGLALLLAAGGGRSSLFTAGSGFRSRDGLAHVRGTGYTAYGLSRQSRLTPLSSYLPGGYGPELSPKNRATLRGLDAMAAELGIEIRPFDPAALLVDAADQAPGSVSTANGSPPARSIDAAVLRKFLAEHWSRLPFERIAAETGLDPSKLQGASEKWYRIIKNGGQGFLNINV